MNKILSSENYYEGMNPKTEEYLLGDYNYLEANNCTNIEFANYAWEDEKDYFKEFLKESIEKYERKYKTDVLEVVLCGKVGRWNGTFIGGKVIQDYDALSMGDSVESIDVIIDEDNSICIEGSHHDGTHRMGIYFITNSVLRNTGYKAYYENFGKEAFDADFFVKLYSIRKPLKLRRKNGFYKIPKKCA